MTEKSTPTLLDLARVAGVSRTTASNAFNRPDQLSPAMRTRILEAAKAIGYPGPNPLARMLRTGVAGAIGVIIPDDLIHTVTDPALMAFLQGIALVCDQQEAGMLLLSAADEAAAKRSVAHAAVDGFIIHCLAAERAILDSVLQRRVPVVAVENAGGMGVPAIRIDDRGGAELAARHLLDLGHRHIGILALKTRPGTYAGPLTEERRRKAIYGQAMDRLAGYEAVLGGAGLDDPPVHECLCYGRASALKGAAALLDHDPRPTAILAMSDVIALAAIEVARARGLRIPDDLSVVGFDDVPVASQVSPPLTTVHQPLVDKGRLAAEMLFQGSLAGPPTILPTRLIVRGSTAPLPASTKTGGTPGAAAGIDRTSSARRRNKTRF